MSTDTFGTGQRAATLCSWEGNRRSGVALAMRHRLSGPSTYTGSTADVWEVSIPPKPHWGTAPLPYLTEFGLLFVGLLCFCFLVSLLQDFFVTDLAVCVKPSSTSTVIQPRTS